MVVTLGEGPPVVSVVDRCAQIQADVVGIDIPLGFPEPGARRQAEVEGRRLLGSRASTLFFTPPREAFDLPWAEARLLGVSKQAWNLGPAIRDALSVADSSWHEVHPELAFSNLAGSPLPPKKTGNGSDARLSVLAEHGLEVTPVLGVPLDDVIDAAVCALTALRIHSGDARSIGGDDGAGSIWC